MTRPLQVLFCDNHLLVVVKPAGLPTVPDASGDPSLLDLAREWVRVEFEKPGAAFLGVVHRLDRPVSGVILFARTSKAAARAGAGRRMRAVAAQGR
jgi:23S rRNA pseudouridine1911/1915/1917 synthase